jgi:hypothetical protein
LYWISSNTSVWRTTEPGVSARLPPTSNREVSTFCGSRGGDAKSAAKRFAPRTRLPPPSSTIALSTVGFDHGKFVGASASSTLPAAKRAWRSVFQSSSASEMTPSTASAADR